MNIPDEMVDELRLSAAMIRTWAPEAFPAYENGQVHFARAIMESVAETIEQTVSAAPASAEPVTNFNPANSSPATADQMAAVMLLHGNEQQRRQALGHANIEPSEKEHWQAWARKCLEIQRAHWLRAAKSALAGDMRELRNRVELSEAAPVEIVQSDSPPITIDT